MSIPTSDNVFLDELEATVRAELIEIETSPPEEAHSVRGDVMIATGRSDYPNQVNNVLCFPFIFRGALDCGATTITTEMELAAARAIAELAQAETSQPEAACVPIDQWLTDPADEERYEVGLRSLFGAVEALEDAKAKGW